jgi:hypothetical protein
MGASDRPSRRFDCGLTQVCQGGKGRGEGNRKAAAAAAWRKGTVRASFWVGRMHATHATGIYIMLCVE